MPLVAAATACLLLLPVSTDGKRSARGRGKRHRDRRDFPLVLQATNQSRPGSPLLRFAVVSDSHRWATSQRRSKWMASSDARSVRDGLLTADSPKVLLATLRQLREFAAAGGSFAVHAGDSLCGGSTFGQPQAEYEANLRQVLAAERVALGDWPVHHMPGNHDVDTAGGGLRAWSGVLGNTTPAEPGVNYRALRRAGWRLLLLDSMDGLPADTDGHGHVGGAQLHWLQAQLHAAAAARENVLVFCHHLLAEPLDAAGGMLAFLDRRQDFVDNRAEVLRALRPHAHVRLVLHAHVHANTITTQFGVVFASGASVAEFPMQWREVQLLPCEARLRARPLGLAALLAKSAARETRGVNALKAGAGCCANVDLVFRGGGICPKADAADHGAPGLHTSVRA